MRLGFLWTFAGLAAALSGCGGSAAGPSDGGAQPNFVLIMADDLDLAPVEHMPLLRQHVASRGMTFTNAFVTDPVCCPSRATVLTGQYAHNHRVLSNEPPLGGWGVFHDSGIEKDTLPVWLRRGGYVSGLVGKYLNRYPEGGPPEFIPQGWDYWQAVFSDRGSDAFFNYSLSSNGRIENYGFADDD